MVDADRLAAADRLLGESRIVATGAQLVADIG